MKKEYTVSAMLQAADECVSHILVPHGKRLVAQKIVTVLEHSGSEVDERLRRIAAAERKEIDLVQKLPLCHLLKATGACQYVHCAVLVLITLCASCCPRGHACSKTLFQQNPSVLNGRC